MVKRCYRALLPWALCCFIGINPSWALKLSDYSPYSYEVLFTNPECALYNYAQPIPGQNGELLLAKPKNVYCKSSDTEASRLRDNHPHNKFVSWILDPKVSAIFLSALSFSNKALSQALCQAVEQNKKITLVLDHDTDQATANQLAECNSEQGQRATILYRSERSGLYHNKFTIFEYQNSDEVRVIFGSANYSAGTTLHHENWNFVTSNRQSYFIQTHLCLKAGVSQDFATNREFVEFVQTCREQIAAEPEEDIQTYLIPGGKAELDQLIKTQVAQAYAIALAVHRFSYQPLIEALKTRLSAIPEQVPDIKMISDDDIYWAGLFRRDIGNNAYLEAQKTSELTQSGMHLRYFETNNNEHLLHHNKFIIFYNKAQNPSGVLTGAGNFTKAAMTRNFENFYWVSIPEVLAAYHKQYLHMWNSLATPYERMPTKLRLP